MYVMTIHIGNFVRLAVPCRKLLGLVLHSPSLSPARSLPRTSLATTQCLCTRRNVAGIKNLFDKLPLLIVTPTPLESHVLTMIGKYSRQKGDVDTKTDGDNRQRDVYFKNVNDVY